MGKTIRKTIQITTRKRHNGVKINEEFYSYDKNNAQFEFIMDYDVPADKVIALFHFEQTNRYYETLCQFKGNRITIEFDTSLIVEDELVTGYLYFDKLEKSTDVYRFTFGARLSEIDKTRELPVQEKVSRRIVPVADIVTKQELEELMDKIKKNGGTYDDKPLLEKIHSIEEQFRNASNLYLQSHQSLEHLMTKKELEDKHYLTSVPEEVTNKLSALETKVQTLENKSVVTHEELENAGYAKTTDLTNLAANSKVEAVENRVLALENKPTIDTNEFAKKSEIPQGYDDSALSGRVSALEAKQDKDTIYNDEEIKRRLTTLEGKTDNFITGVSVNKEGSNVTLTYNYVDGQTKNVSFTDSDTVNVAYDDSGLKQRITNLENRPQVDLTDYAKKSEIPQAYNDNELSRRVSVLEAKEDKDTIYNDEEIKRRLTTLEAKPTVDVSAFAKKTEVPTVDSVNNLLRTQGEQSVKISTLEAKAGYEIHGTGMPNGQVSAPIGTTYVDMNVTNGALKWIKRTGTGNTGWQVLTGDTGWRTLPLINKRGNAKLQVRRINDQVIVKFDGLSWGWFGVDDIDKQEKAGNIVDKNIGGKKYTWINLNIGRGSNVLSVGFRSASSTLAGLYGNLGDLLGSVYVGGTADQNAIQLRYAMPKSELNNTILSQIRISPVTFITDDEWPTTLP